VWPKRLWVQTLLETFIIKKYPKFKDSKAFDIGWCDLPISHLEKINK
jgi:hypothetical protein